MRLIRIIAYALIMDCAILFAAEPVDEGRLYIANTHPKLQFECKYSTHTTEGALIDVPTVVYRDKIYLGRIRDIRDIQIKRYGRYLGAGAKYYSYAGLLDECRKRPDQDCMLQINPAFNLETWDVAKSNANSITSKTQNA